MKYLRYYFRMFKLCAMDQMANRGNFLTWAFIYLITVAVYLIFFRVIFSGTTAINGWTEKQALLVYGTSMLVQGLGSMTFFSFMYFFSDDIAKGRFDFKLLKPMNSLFLAAFPYIDLEDFTTIPLAILVIIYSWPAATALGLVTYVFLIFCALIFLFSLLTIVQSMAFKTTQVSNSRDAFWTMLTSARYPAKMMLTNFPNVLVILFPMILISSVPAEALFGRLQWNWIAASVLTAAFLFFLSRWVFQNALKNYSSASS